MEWKNFWFHLSVRAWTICNFKKELSIVDDKTRLLSQGRRWNRTDDSLPLIEPGSNRYKDNSLPVAGLPSPPDVSRSHPNSIHLWSIGNIARGPESLLHFSFDESFSGRGQRVLTIKVLEDCLKARRRLAKRFPSPPSSRWNLNSKRGGTIGKPWTNVREDGSLSLPLETKEGAKGKEQQQQQQRHQRGE